MELIFATQNQNKLQEIKSMLPQNLQIKSLQDLNYHEELPETHETLHENALEKANFVAQLFNTNCFAEDTGLEVEALNNAPGVFSARYAGEHKNHTDNINLLLKNLAGESNRAARFRTVIALILNGKEYIFEGTVEGHIIEDPKGNKGFGYDPVFVANGFTETFAQISIEEKNNISHRAKAFSKLKTFLNTL
jgi:XTP/dITP diphosphohydrolase